LAEVDGRVDENDWPRRTDALTRLAAVRELEQRGDVSDLRHRSHHLLVVREQIPQVIRARGEDHAADGHEPQGHREGDRRGVFRRRRVA
jgi:hypothetical protein